MQKRFFRIAGAVVVVVVALTFAADGQAGLLDRLKRNRASKKHNTGTQMAAGIYSGSLRGEILLQKRKVMITDETFVYVIGRGGKDGRAMVVNQRPVAATGRLVGSVLVADMIIVRPQAKPPVGLTAPDDGRVTWGHNPNVGTINEGDFE
jgi:hypothetical protein